MTHTEILDRINGIVAEVLGTDELSLNLSTTAADVEGWDSLTHVQIMVAVERAFGIRFRTGEMAALANVGELVHRIASRLPHG